MANGCNEAMISSTNKKHSEDINIRDEQFVERETVPVSRLWFGKFPNVHSCSLYHVRSTWLISRKSPQQYFRDIANSQANKQTIQQGWKHNVHRLAELIIIWIPFAGRHCLYCFTTVTSEIFCTSKSNVCDFKLFHKERLTYDRKHFPENTHHTYKRLA